MKNILYCIMIVAITFAAGCAANHSKPIIDPESVDMEQYQYDLAECEQIAEQVEQKAASGAVGGAVVGGLIGAIVGDSDSVKRSAGVGGVLGGAKGAGATERERSQVVKNCLRNRGYTILN
jgi:outer membrane lipoprotein SlyB